jgi:G3E family GTPase
MCRRGRQRKEGFTMTKIDIVSGFLGAGKTTLIKKLLAEAFQGEKLVLIENEFGEISIDGGFLKESGVQISEMSSGCICCSLVGDFNKALKDVHQQFAPDRILIEPSGVGKLSDVIVAVENTVKDVPDMKLNSFVTVADATKVKVYMKNFGEFYNNQIESAGTIILSRTQKLTQEKLEAAVALLREKNPSAAILTTPWDELDGKTILSAIEKVSLADELLARMQAEHAADEAEHHHHHDHDEDDDHDHCCHHDHEEHDHCHHDHDEDEHCHHHEHDHEDHDEHEHHHHHHDGEECDDPHCGCHHHHHHADEVFTSWGVETVKVFTESELETILTALDSGDYGAILRAKGIVHSEDGKWLHFDFVPEEHQVRFGAADYTGRLCVIGSQLKEDKLAELFGL